MMIRAQSCRNCKHVNADDGVNQLACRRYPPDQVMTITPKGPAIQTAFRRVQSNWCCGEWTPGIVGQSDA